MNIPISVINSNDLLFYIVDLDENKNEITICFRNNQNIIYDDIELSQHIFLQNEELAKATFKSNYVQVRTLIEAFEVIFGKIYFYVSRSYIRKNLNDTGYNELLEKFEYLPEEVLHEQFSKEKINMVHEWMKSNDVHTEHNHVHFNDDSHSNYNYKVSQEELDNQNQKKEEETRLRNEESRLDFEEGREKYDYRYEYTKHDNVDVTIDDIIERRELIAMCNDDDYISQESIMKYCNLLDIKYFDYDIEVYNKILRKIDKMHEVHVLPRYIVIPENYKGDWNYMKSVYKSFTDSLGDPNGIYTNLRLPKNFTPLLERDAFMVNCILTSSQLCSYPNFVIYVLNLFKEAGCDFKNMIYDEGSNPKEILYYSYYAYWSSPKIFDLLLTFGAKLPIYHINVTHTNLIHQILSWADRKKCLEYFKVLIDHYNFEINHLLFEVPFGDYYKSMFHYIDIKFKKEEPDFHEDIMAILRNKKII